MTNKLEGKIGQIMYTMCRGQIVKAKLISLGARDVQSGFFGEGTSKAIFEFINHINGDTELCFEFLGWSSSIVAGQTFVGNEHGPERAAYYMKGTENESKLLELTGA